MPKKYSEPDIEKALVLAATIGLRPAERQLGIAESTIRNWIRDQPARYAEIKTQLAPQWRERAAAETEEIVESLAALERQAAERLATDLPKLEPKDVPNALKSITLSKGINLDKANGLRDRPQVTVEHNINMPQIDQAIGLLLNRGAVDTDATELGPDLITEGEMG